MDTEKTVAEQMKEQLFHSPKNGWQLVSETESDGILKFSETYRDFLSSAKTEREVTAFAVEQARQNGFEEFDKTKSYQTGDKLFFANRGKALILAVIGREPLSEGARICAAHIDSPRVDLKPRPLYEDSELALFKTHYYGGIKKYQWTAVPLALHGVVALKDGSVVDVCIGEDDNDPVFTLNDLLPHLATEQGKRTLADGVLGEELNLLVGSRPFRDDKASELVKLNILNILNEKYGITEIDFTCAELQLVPAFKARDVGLDASMIGAYGQDDRVCAYTALRAIFCLSAPKHTAIVVLADKEEVGSDGNTGLASSFFEYFMHDLAGTQRAWGRHVLSASKCLSADVNAAFDPTFAGSYEKRNCAFLNYGAIITKYTGSRGKSGTSDASAEYMAWVRKLLEDNNVVWQTAELGTADLGGGGTVAKYLAALDVETVDLGVPVLSMHSPFEVVSKLDVYMAYRAFCAFMG